MPEMLKARDVAKRLNTSVSNVYAMIKSGALPAVRFGRAARKAIRVSSAELEKLIHPAPVPDFKMRQAGERGNNLDDRFN